MKIGDICAYAPKSQIKAGEAIDGAEYMFFTSSPDENKRYSEYQIDGEGIIMGTGGNATLHYYSGKFATSTDCIVLLPRNTLRCKYLYYYLKANMNILEAGFKGAGLKHTNKKSHAPHLPIPPRKWYPLPKNEVSIMEEKIIAITNEMAEVLNIAQLKKLQEVLVKAFSTEEPERKPTNHEYLRLFLEAKSIEGCSPRTLQYYEVTVQHLFAAVNLPVRKMTTERMREYLSDYQQRRNCSKATIDNIRRNISSFFSWLEEEDHILKSPMRRIHKIKTKKTVKEVISDEDIEKLRDSCTTLRDLAMIDLLYSTGIRVGELVRLNIEDVNFESRECVVFGKGDKERRVYFDAKTKIHLKNYLESRRDTNRALFVSLLAPYNRLAISGVEIRLRKMGRMLNLKSIHPHKFRRTMATRAIDKGMPIEQVQKILGHSQIDTTMQYAIVNQNNVKMSHQKYIA